MTSRHAAIELEWGDGTFTFRLGLDELDELEDKLDASIFVLRRKLSPELQLAKSREIRETLRIGLIGGGMPAVDALRKVRRYLDERPLDESRDAAYAVALAALSRVHGKELADDPGERLAAEPSASTSPPSAPAPQ